MWRIWYLFDPRRALIAMTAFLFFLAFWIHLVLLSTDRFNWLEGASLDQGTPTAMQQHAPPAEQLAQNTTAQHLVQ